MIMNANNNNDSSVLDEQRVPAIAWLIWGVAASFFALEYFARVAPSVMVPQLMHDFQVNAQALGSLSAFFYYAYVSMPVPVGMLVDRYGVRRLLTIMAIICAANCLLLAVSSSFWVAQLARFLMGFSAAFAFVSALKLAATWFPLTRFGLLSGLTQALGMLGAAVSEGSMAHMVATIGWRLTLVVVAVGLFCLAIVIGIVVRDHPTGKAMPTGSTKQYHFLAGLKTILRNPQTWINAAFAGCIYAPTAAFGELWGVSYFVQTYHLEVHTAAWAIGFIFIGWGIGGPIMGWISDQIQRRRPIMLISALLGTILLVSVLYIPHLPLPLLYLLLLLYGVSNTGLVVSYAASAEINPHRVAGTSMAFANMASVIIGAACQPIIGWLLDQHWTGQMLNGVRVYSAESFREAMLLLPVIMLFSLLFAWLFKETYCKRVEERFAE